MIRVPRRAIRTITVLYFLWMVTVSLLPSGKDVLHNWDQDVATPVQKALHVAAYAVLVVLVSMAWLPAPKTGYGWVLLVVLICSVLGAILEVAQIWVPGRWAAPRDALLNVAGATAGALLFLLWSRRRSPSRSD